MPAKKSLPATSDAEMFIKEIGDPDLALFFLAWLKNDLDATAAYAETHPNVTHGSAQVGGHRMLTRVKPQILMSAYNLGPDRYFKQLDKGLEAMKWNDFTGEREEDHSVREKYHTKLGKILGIEQQPVTLNQTNINEMTLEFVANDRKTT